MSGTSQSKKYGAVLASVTVLAFSLILVTSLLAQGPWRGGPPMGPGLGFHLDGLLGDFLELTDSQKAQVEALKESARTQARPIREQLKQVREEMQTAIQSGQGGSALQSLATSQGQLIGQLIGIEATTQTQTYALLTPAQKEKLAQFMEQRKARREERKKRFQSGQGPDSGATQ